MDSICQFSGLMQYLALHLDWLFTLRFLLCSCSQFFTVSCHRCRLWLTCLQSESVATSVPPEGWVHQPSTTHSGTAYGSWYFLACVLASMFVKGGGGVESIHVSVLLCIGVKISPIFKKTGSERGSHVVFLITCIWKFQFNPRFSIWLSQSEMAFFTCGRCSNTL